MATKADTPSGKATLVEELTLNQRAGDKRFGSIVQLLESERGERFVRFAYSTGGTARRGPVTLRARDVDRLRAALTRTPALAETRFGWGWGLDECGSRQPSSVDQRPEDQRAVGRAEQRIHRVLRMRHQSEYVA